MTYFVTAEVITQAIDEVTGGAAHPVRHHRQRDQASALAHEIGGLGDAGGADDELAPERAEEKMVLVLAANLAGVGQAMAIDLFVLRPQAGGGRHAAGAGVGGGHLSAS